MPTEEEAKVDDLKEHKLSLEARNNNLHQEYQRLCKEISQVKSDLLRHTDCRDANIDRWIENEAKGNVQKLAQDEERQRMGSPSITNGAV
jgi:hypothetical protein